MFIMTIATLHRQPFDDREHGKVVDRGESGCRRRRERVREQRRVSTEFCSRSKVSEAHLLACRSAREMR